MSTHLARDGDASVAVDGLDEEIARVLGLVSPSVRTVFEREAHAIVEAAREFWPVRSGRSRDGFLVDTRLTPDALEVVISNAETYAYKIKFSVYTRGEIEGPQLTEKRQRHMVKWHGRGPADDAWVGKNPWQLFVRGPAKKAEARLAVECETELVRLVGG